MEGKYTQDLIEIPRGEYRELIERYVAAEVKLEASEKKWLDLYSRNKSLEEKNRKLEEMLNGKHES